MGHFSTKTTANTVNDRDALGESRAKCDTDFLLCVCVRECVYWPDTMTLQGWGPDAGVASRRARTQTCINSERGTCRLSLHNTAVVLETLTRVSVEASKQRNNRAEKNQSTRQLAPVQDTGTRADNRFPAPRGPWAERGGRCVFRWEWWGKDRFPSDFHKTAIDMLDSFSIPMAATLQKSSFKNGTFLFTLSSNWKILFLFSYKSAFRPYFSNCPKTFLTQKPLFAWCFFFFFTNLHVSFHQGCKQQLSVEPWSRASPNFNENNVSLNH